MSLLITLRSEMLKTKRAAAVYLAVIAAALIPFILLMDVCLGEISPANKNNLLNVIVREAFPIMGAAIFPMFIMLMCTMLAQIEYRNNTWKQVLASPQPFSNIFIARFLNVHLLILLFMLLFNMFIGIAAVIIYFVVPAAGIFNQPFDWHALWTWNVNIYLAILALSAMQFWMGLRFRNFIIPLAIGFSLWLTGMLMVMAFNSKSAHLFPYSYLPLSCLKINKHLLPMIQLSSVGYMLGFLGLGFLDFKRRNTK